ncbi:RND family efflux transporter MFP subunit [Lachnotalea glycerini]|nr:efflux RND transporter periplasmic adaptor subunit [Lachnotalea glycerini]PXV86730.1 RND family efflux transporter MFP subunit [Lachnotalea glycerini]
MFKKKKDNDMTELKEVKPARKKNKKLIKRIIIAGVIIVILALIILPRLFTPEVLPTVTTQKAYKGDIEQVLSTSGFVESEETKICYSDVSAKITEFNVEKGSNVHSGDVLVAFDEQALENAYKQQELQNNASKAEYAQVLADASENATKYQNSSTDVSVLEQQVEDQQNSVESIQVSINDEANYLTNLNSDLAAIQASLEEATTANNTSKVEKYTKKIKEIKKKIKNSNDYTTDLNNQLISAQNELSELQSNLSEQKSIKSTSEAGLLSGNEKTQKSATTQVTSLTLEQAQANLEKAKAGITAEFNGIITDVQAAQGATVAEGTALFTIASNEDVKLTVALTKYDLEDVKEGQTATITLGASTYTGTVTKISRVATTNSAGAAVINADIHIDNPDDNIYLGVEAKVKISVGSASNVVLVPVECINTDKDGSFCYVVENGTVVRKNVTTGLSSDEYIEVKEGIAEGEEVISEITTNIVEGAKVTVIPSQDISVTDTTTSDTTENATEESTEKTSEETTENETEETTTASDQDITADSKDTQNSEDNTNSDEPVQE